jgi:SAM-dependent methyltransferase
MRKLMDELPDGAVLDVGSGTGRHTAYLVEAGREVVGVEPNDAMRELAEKKLPDVEFEKGDVSALPVEDGSFKNVVCGLVFSHLPDIGPPLVEIARVMQPGGHALISIPHTFISTVLFWRAPVFDAQGNGWWIPEIPHLPSEYLEAFAEAGMVARRCYEPRFTPQHAVWRPDASDEENPFADALTRAIAGQPGVMIWQAERT